MRTEYKDENDQRSTEAGKERNDFNLESSCASQQMNNNGFVVPIGVLIVIFTIYLTALFVNKSFGSSNVADIKNTYTHADISQIDQSHVVKYKMDGAKGPKLVCKNSNIIGKEDWHTEKPVKEIFAIRSKSMSEHRRSEQNCDAKAIGKKRLQSKHGMSTHRMRRKRYISSSKQINNNNRSKGINSSSVSAANIKNDQIKKTTSTEPVIYVFVVVFIYLLFKATKDITNHYKMQAKGDKRFRRCSLQSYAQIHKQDRRASKVYSHEFLKNIQCSVNAQDRALGKHRFMELRSSSVDRFVFATSPIDHHKSEIRSTFRKHTSVDESHPEFSHRLAQNLMGIHLPQSTTNDKPHTDRSDPMICTQLPNQTMKCQQLVCALRRGSMNNSDIITLPTIFDMPGNESRRRVRMINRH